MANFYFLLKSKLTCGQSYKASTIVIYDSRVVNYERKLFIRLATELFCFLNNGPTPASFCSFQTQILRKKL